MTYNCPLYTDYPKVEKDSNVVKAGTVILSCKPFAYALAAKFSDIRCDTCFVNPDEKTGGDEGHSLSRCGNCSQVRYCDRECQRKGWADGHKYECKGFKTHRRPAGAFTRVLLRIVIKLQGGNDYYDEVTRKRTRRRFKDLVSHYSDLKNNKAKMEQVEAMCEVMRSCLVFHPEIKIPNEAELTGICGRIFVNTFSITDYESRTLGSGLYLGASIFDHSCEPIAVANFESTNITIRTIQEIPITLPILKVTICYRDTLRPTCIRKEELKKGYYFECQCERCSQNLYDYPMNAVMCPNSECESEVNLQASGNKCPNCNYQFDENYINKLLEMEEMGKSKVLEMGDNAYLDVAEACIRIFNGLKFSDTHWLMVEMTQVGFDSCVEMQQWERAYRYGQLALKGNRRYLYKIHPSLGLMLLKMAKLAWYLEKEAEAKAYITEAKTILYITHGGDSPYVRENLHPLIQEISLCSRFKNGLTNGHS